MAKGRKTSKPRFWILMALLFAVGTACVCGSQARYLRLQNDTLAELQARESVLVEEKTGLERQLEFMETDTYIIREARAKLGYLMPGEILFTEAE